MDRSGQKRKTTKVGTVIAKKMQKTVTVQVVRQIRHPLYKKIVRKRQTFLVHDGAERCKVGDVVRIIETRPISKMKRWRVLEIVGLTPALTASEVAEVEIAPPVPETPDVEAAGEAGDSGEAASAEDLPEAAGDEGEPR
jgi:small subunit ribosomal protein S17